MQERLCHRRICPVRHKQRLRKEISLHICTTQPLCILDLELCFHLFGEHRLIICNTLFRCAFNSLTRGVEVKLYYIRKLKQRLCIISVFIVVKREQISHFLKLYTPSYYLGIRHYVFKKLHYKYIARYHLRNSAFNKIARKIDKRFFAAENTRYVIHKKCIIYYIGGAHITVIPRICIDSGLISVKQLITKCIVIHIKYRLTCKKYVLHRDPLLRVKSLLNSLHYFVVKVNNNTYFSPF